MKTNCSCCREINHSMVLDGIEGFTSQEKIMNGNNESKR
jgi:hypothetical protein